MAWCDWDSGCKIRARAGTLPMRVDDVDRRNMRESRSGTGPAPGRIRSAGRCRVSAPVASRFLPCGWRGRDGRGESRRCCHHERCIINLLSMSYRSVLEERKMRWAGIVLAVNGRLGCFDGTSAGKRLVAGEPKGAADQRSSEGGGASAAVIGPQTGLAAGFDYEPKKSRYALGTAASLPEIARSSCPLTSSPNASLSSSPRAQSPSTPV